MGASIQRITFVNITSVGPQDFPDTTEFSVINNSENTLTIKNSTDGFTNSIVIAKGQSFDVSADTGFELPTMRIEPPGSGAVDISIIYK